MILPSEIKQLSSVVQITPFVEVLLKNSSFCTPEDEINKLKEVANKGTPLKFIKGNGEYVGVFVITEISSVTEQASNEGDFISIQVDLKLIEYTGPIPEENEQQGGLKKK